MHQDNRRLFFSLFALTYIVILPFLIIFSLGYDIDFRTQTIKNSLSIRIETVPRNAEIPVGDEIYRTPTELRVRDGVSLGTEIKANGFLNEKFTFWSPSGENTSVRVQNLWLLPSSFENQFYYKDKDFLAILDSNQILYQQNDNFYIQNYAFSGLQGNVSQVTNFSSIKPNPGRWEEVWNSIFFKSNENLLLVKNGSNWEMLNFFDFKLQVVSVASLSDKLLLILDSRKNLWTYDISNRLFSFLDNGYVGLFHTESPSNVWLARDSYLIRFSRNTNILTPETLRNSRYFDFSKLGLNLQNTIGFDQIFYNQLRVSSVFLGLAFQIGKYLLYLPDSNTDSGQLISDSVFRFNTSNNSLFWLDESGNLFFYNLFFQTHKYLGQLQMETFAQEDVKLFYYANWRRIFVYNSKTVYSVWQDTEFQNRGVSAYYPVLWIQNQQCVPKLENNYQFCIKDNTITTYKNNSIPI